MHDPLACFMAALLTTFARHFNRKYGLVGHVFQGRYGALLCQDETYLLRLVRYIHRNPLRAGMSSGVDFAWSSYGAHLGRTSDPIVDSLPVLRHFGAELAPAREAFREYHEGPGATNDSNEDLAPRRGIVLGDPSFEERETRRAARSAEPTPLQRPSLDEVLEEALRISGIRVEPIEVRGPSRRHAAALVRSSFVEMAVEASRYRYVEVAGFLGRSPENVRTILARLRATREAAIRRPAGY
jgi:putative transposase